MRFLSAPLVAVAVALAWPHVPPAIATSPTPPSTVPDDAAAPAEPAVSYVDGRLSVHARDAALPDVMRAVATATGAEIRGVVPSHPVSVRFDRLRPPAAIARLLGEQSFMLRYRKDGSLRGIDIVNRGTQGPLAMPAATPRGRPLAGAERDAATLQKPVTVDGQLASALGGDQQTIGRVLHAAVGEGDPEVREAARESIIKAFADNPDAEAAYLASLQPVDDAKLAEILASQGPGAEDLLAALIVRSRSPALRAKITGVLSAMQQRGRSDTAQP